MSTISYLTRVEFGEGQVSRLQEFLDLLGVKRPLLCTDRGLVATGMVQRIAALLKAPPAIFDGTPANPTEEAVLAAHAQYVAEGCDGIIGLGGGSALDLAKGVRLLTGHDGPLAQYTLVAGGLARIHGRICPLIAIPTTAGTGSEVGRAAVIITAEGRKLGIISPHMLPSIALCDPELTYGLPPGLTAATGMDAISHCLETFMAPAFNPPADAIALDGLARGWRSIEKAVRDGSDKSARNDMMVCALEGALAFQKGLGAVHALTHPLGAIRQLNLHHGTLNAVLMPAVLRFNRPAIGAKWDQLQSFFGEAPDVAVAKLNQRLGMPAGLAAMGVTEEMLRPVAEDALKDHCHATNPRTPTADDYLVIMRESC
ncbi:4-hydroxybutyrate dehydrogenase [Aestuariivirga litoralis]|uniref:4-hydroxybutyrate dehydrogenase n=1 Tax=Aestuariivirga litoralis TaxID=2650924 RepID=A0A2W2BD18_9HYPH|nr:iron-containing alcohol dehydrogenase [Aestuariivirga litoralis]PZF78088.1 4-hydroxybutyrate dehydrogenase [Aestuariivirga litoralis]